MKRIMRLVFDVEYDFEDDPSDQPNTDVCAELLNRIVQGALDDGQVSGSYDFIVADFHYRVEELICDPATKCVTPIVVTVDGTPLSQETSDVHRLCLDEKDSAQAQSGADTGTQQ